VKSSHDCNCHQNCSWNVYVRNGIVWREEQAGDFEQSIPGLPDFNPGGCQKGAIYSQEMYSPTRIKFPMKRVGPRGSGKWKRISWDEALSDIARQLIEIVRDEGHDTITTSIGSQAVYSMNKNSPAKIRFADLIGGVVLDSQGEVGDGHLGAMQTAGHATIDGGADTRLYSKCIINWIYNPSVTRIPDSHFIQEARYNGATIISISPDQNPSHLHADIWVNPKPGTDAALALSMAHLIVKQKLYDEAHMKEQTDLPFLVRKDTQKFLRESDVETSGSDQVFYFWDKTTNQSVKAPGSMGSKEQSLRLGNIDPMLEGHFNVKLADGSHVNVTTVFELLKPSLDKYSPERTQEITGVGAATISRITHEYATRGPALIQMGWGQGKLYHSDLFQRSAILLSALTGNTGKVGGGYWIGGVMETEGIWAMAVPVATKTGKARIVPTALWHYIHSGMREASSRWAPVPEGNKTADDYIMESIQKFWMPVFPPPGSGRHPRALIECGSNLLRRTRMNEIMKRELWPKLKLVLTIDMRMSTTALNSDYVLPAAGYYETEGLKYTDTKTPYHTYKGKAVEPVGESRDEWWIFASLCKRIQELAPSMGITSFKDIMFGFERNLGTLYDDYTEHGKWHENIESAKMVQHMMNMSTGYKGVSFGDIKKKGHISWINSGGHGKEQGMTGDYEPGKPFTANTDYTQKKQPWNTLTGRQQFYLDHDWFIEFGEQLPVHKEAPAMGGNHPLQLTSGHARWSIHSSWRDNKLLLRQQRGEPIAYINPRDANARGIADNEMVEVFNDISSFRVRVMVTPTMQTGQVHMQHAWETFQFEKGVSQQSVFASQINPLHCIGDYGHLKFGPAWYQPNSVDKCTRVDVRKV